MNNFNKIIVGDKEIDSNGSFNQTENIIEIRGFNKNVRRHFTEIIRGRSPYIKHIEFVGIDSNNSFRGRYLIMNANSTRIILAKEQ